MRFLCNSRVPEGVSHELVIEHLKRGSSEEEWELIKKEVISHWVFKIGDQPGITIILNCTDMEEAKRLVETAPLVKEGILEFEIDPVDHFPRFE